MASRSFVVSMQRCAAYFAFHAEADDATLADSNAVGHGLRTRSNLESKFPGRLDVQIWVIAAATYFDWS